MQRARPFSPPSGGILVVLRLNLHDVFATIRYRVLIRHRGRLDDTLLRCASQFCFFSQLNSNVNKTRHSDPHFCYLFFSLPSICSVRADDAPSLAVYVPWLSLSTSLPPSVACWSHVAAVGVVRSGREDSSWENFQLSPFHLFYLLSFLPSTELVFSSDCCPARMPLAALLPSPRQKKPWVDARIV